MDLTMPLSRRQLLQSAGAAAGLLAVSPLARLSAAAVKGAGMAYGLVTYQWGKDWDLPTLIANLEKAKVLGVELRTTHAHGVEPSLNDRQREEVRRRFADSPVTLVGIGSNERFDNPDPEIVKKAIEASKEFIRLSHDVGGSGVKVKPDRFHDGVPHEKTIEQIGRSLNELGEYAAGFGQQIRLEVHGQCAQLPTIKAILDVADNENVAICWNSNQQDLEGKGLEANYRLVADRFGGTCHVRELDSPDYPYQKLIDLLVADDYEGWVMLEASSKPKDPVAALARQGKLFQEMVAKAQA
jgi:sugar phosphate isomerase/epimerase